MRKFVRRNQNRILVDALIVVSIYAVVLYKENRRLRDEYYPED